MGNIFMEELSNDSLIRLKDVLKIVAVGRSTWLAGCKSGRFPKPVHPSPRTTAWRVSDIKAYLESLSAPAA